MPFRQVKLSLKKSKPPYAQPKLVSPKTKSIFAEQKESFTNINFHLQKWVPPPSGSQLSCMQNYLLPNYRKFRERNQNHYKQPNLTNDWNTPATSDQNWKQPKPSNKNGNALNIRPPKRTHTRKQTTPITNLKTRSRYFPYYLKGKQTFSVLPKNPSQ